MPAQPIMLSQGDGKDLAVCKDWLRGICGRSRCKFRHPASNENFNQSPSPTSSRNSFDGHNGGHRGTSLPVGNFAMNNSHNMDAYSYGRPPLPGTNMPISSNYGYGNDQYAQNGNANKRKRNFDTMYSSNNAVPFGTTPFEAMNPAVHGFAMHSTPLNDYYAVNGSSAVRPPMIEGQRSSFQFLEEENLALRRRVDDLKNQVKNDKKN